MSQTKGTLIEGLNQLARSLRCAVPRHRGRQPWALREGEKLVNIIMGCERIELTHPVHKTELESPFSTEPLGSISQALRGPPQQSHVHMSPHTRSTTCQIPGNFSGRRASPTTVRVQSQTVTTQSTICPICEQEKEERGLVQVKLWPTQLRRFLERVRCRHSS